MACPSLSRGKPPQLIKPASTSSQVFGWRSSHLESFPKSSYRASQPAATSSSLQSQACPTTQTRRRRRRLFSIPIALGGDASADSGVIVCSEPEPGVYLLAWTAPPDNRLTTVFCQALLEALDLLEAARGDAKAGGVLITTSTIAKFYSNGLDLGHAVATPGFWPLLYSVWRRLLTFPMPTIALLNGHAYAGGLMLAMAHDYRLAPSPRGFLCLNEVLFGAPLKPAMAALFRAKLPMATAAALALEARRLSGRNAVALGVAHALAPRGLPDALDFARDRGLREKSAAGVYGLIRAELYSPLLAYLDSRQDAGGVLDAHEQRFDTLQKAEADRIETAKASFQDWRLNKNKVRL